LGPPPQSAGIPPVPAHMTCSTWPATCGSGQPVTSTPKGTRCNEGVRGLTVRTRPVAHRAAAASRMERTKTWDSGAWPTHRRGIRPQRSPAERLLSANQAPSIAWSAPDGANASGGGKKRRCRRYRHLLSFCLSRLRTSPEALGFQKVWVWVFLLY